jgi:hypothetical protein
MSRGEFVPLAVPGGVVKVRSGEGAAGRWFDALNARFVSGKPCKRGGFERLNDTLMVGKARGMECWNTVRGDPLYSVGTNERLYGSTDGEDVINITPLRFPQSWEDVLSTTINLGAVTVHMVAHGYSLGKLFVVYGGSFQGGAAVGGIALVGIWELVEVVDVDNFKIASAADTGTLGADPFAMVNLSAVVTVTDTAHGRATGDAVWFAGAAAAAGITIAGDYKITVVDANSYTITHGSAATSTASGGGAAVTYHYGDVATSSVALGGGGVDYYLYLANPFDTTDTDATVTVTHASHGARSGDTIIIDGATAVGGLTLDGEFEIATVIGANSYTIEAASAATSTATGGGTAVLIEYEISTGPADKITAALRGFGTGTLGSGFFGASGPANDATYFDPRTWAIDKNGEDAVMSPLGGTIYYWDSSVAGRADRIPNAPTGLRFMFQTEERHLHALGLGGDPLLFGWASQDDLNVWDSTSTNTANEGRRVREGSALVAGTPVGGGMNLIWTDTAVYEHQYTGSKFIYDTRLGASQAGLIAPQAFARTPLGVMWMSQTKFKMWNGSTQDVPNSGDVETWVFSNVDPNQKSKCFAHYDAFNNSVDFYFVPINGAEPSLVVTVCLDDWSWINNTETRTTGSAFPAGDQKPLRVNEGKVFRHEVGLDADGVAANSYIELAPYEIGKSWSEITGFDPDFIRQTGAVTLAIETYDRVSTAPIDTETATIAVGDELADLRSSGRHIGLTLSQNVLAGDWAIDTPQIEVAVAGRRR